MNGVGSLNLHLKHEFPQSLLAAIRVLSKMFPLYLDVTFIRPHLNYLKTYVLQRLQLFFFHVFFQSFVERTFNSKEFQCFRCHEVVIMNPLQLMDLRDDVQLKDYGRVTLVDWSTRRPSDLKDLG